MNIVEWVGRLFRRRREVVIEQPSGLLLSETDAGKLGQIIITDTCPSCGAHKGFFDGPKGGISTNIFCINCGQGYNFTWMFDEPHAEMIDKREPPWAINVRGTVDRSNKAK